jgi:small subunit ribosomal protein S17
MSEQQTGQQSHVATKQGYVVSDKLDRTVAVRVNYQQRHSKYGKYLQRQAKYQVHDPENEAKNGDLVEIALCRPISKTKSWRLVRVIEAAPPPVEHRRQSEAAASASEAESPS